VLALKKDEPSPPNKYMAPLFFFFPRRLFKKQPPGKKEKNEQSESIIGVAKVL